MWEQLKKSLKYLPPFLLAVFLYAFITNHDETMALLRSITSGLAFLTGRFVVGFMLAYFINLFMRWLEGVLKFKRWMSIALSYIVLLGIFIWISVYVVPLVFTSINQIFLRLPAYYEAVREFTDAVLTRVTPEARGIVESTIEDVSGGVVEFLKGMVNTSTLGSALKESTRMMLNLGFGVLISFYTLLGKDRLKETGKRTLSMLAKPKRSKEILDFLAEADRSFSKFIVGKFLDSLIIGLMSFILYICFGIPLYPFLALIAGVFNMIPYFGPLIYGVITGIILLCFEPVYALYAVLIIVALQTFDGAFLGPKILGDAVGITPLLTIVAITIGGDLGGLLGMFIAVPVVATCKMTIIDKLMEKRSAAVVEQT